MNASGITIDAMPTQNIGGGLFWYKSGYWIIGMKVNA
jgi:hypothetical protein